MIDSAKAELHSLRGAWGPAGIIWMGLVAWSLVRVPVPAVNEPYYLGKAMHWWNPGWCAGDLLLESANPHLFFYVTFGALTNVLSLPAAAIAGRIIGLLILAVGWQSLSSAITGRRWGGVLALPILLMLQALGSLSGEWLVGGIEGKVPSYGFLFLAFGCFLRGRFLAAGITAGLAVSFHPLVGLWGILAGGVATLCSILRSNRAGDSAAEQSSSGRLEDQSPIRIPTLVQGAMMLGVMAISALPGLIPALTMLQEADASLNHLANQLQVGSRLAHHLDPMKFPKESYRYWGCLIAVWLLIETWLPPTPRRRWWNTCVYVSMAIVLLGVLIGWGPRPVGKMPLAEPRLSLLKFYFFRMGDQLVPIALSLAAVPFAAQLLQRRQNSARAQILIGSSWVGIVAASLLIPFPDTVPSRMSPTAIADWKEACQWLQSNSASGELVHVTDTGWGTKWFAHRPEYVNFKDMPQDTPSIVEWNRRLWVIANWRREVTADGRVSAEELAALNRETGIRWLICGRFGPIDVSPAYENGTFRIYEVPASDEERIPSPIGGGTGDFGER